MNNNLEIHQLLPGFTTGDAISNEVLNLQGLFRKWGYGSEIFAIGKHTSPMVRHLCHEYTEYNRFTKPGNIIVYHHSIGSPLAQYLKTIQDKKVLIYHNITPDRYLRGINTEKAFALHQGREQLKELVGVPDICFADSEYNRLELAGLGYKNTFVLPIMLDFNQFKEKPKKALFRKYKDNFINLLFVGRITPNKKVEDVIKAYYYYKETININSRLFIVGSYVGTERYYDYLRALAMELNLRDVIFTGHVNNSELIAYYKLASVFLCMSEHEGFCVPLIESMYFGIPIIAYSAAAVPYTLGGSGILVYEKDFPKIAELIDIVLCNRQKIVEGQYKRLEEFSSEKVEKELYAILYNFSFS